MRQVSLTLFVLLALALLISTAMRWGASETSAPGAAPGAAPASREAALLVEDPVPPSREHVQVIEPPDVLEGIGYVVHAPEATGGEDMFWGRLCAADSGVAVARAVVRQSHFVVVMSDADGYFQFTPPFRFTMLRARADAAGFATTQFMVDGEHTTRGAALTIPMQRGATLAARVVDAGGEPTPGIRVQLRNAADDGRWNMQLGGGQAVGTDHLVLAAVTDADGRAEVGGLAAGRGYRVELTRARKRGRVLSTPAENLRVAPGERRAETFALPVLDTVRGRMRYEDGTPCAGGLVWILAAEGSGGRYYDAEATPLEAVYAGPEGEFEIQDVPAGRWVIGPGTPYDFRIPSVDVMPMVRVQMIRVRFSPAAFADARINVPDPSRGEIAVRAYAGRTLQGILTAEKSVSGAVYVFAEPLQDSGLLYAKVGVGGRFALKPLAPGNVRLRVVVTGRGEHALLGPTVQPTDAVDVRLTILHSLVGGAEEGRRMFQAAIELSGGGVPTRIGSLGYSK